MSPRAESLSADQARRLAISATLLSKSRTRRVNEKAAMDVARALGVIQIDSVNVFMRAHYMPLFSRLGTYRIEMLDDLAYRRRRLFEYWAHVASYVPMESYPLWVWKMNKYRDLHGAGKSLGSLSRFVHDNPDYVKRVRKEVERGGPISTKELEDPGTKRGPWWGWAQGKMALEWLFLIGEVSVAERRGFTRYYDIRERVIPLDILEQSPPGEMEAKRQLVLMAVRSLGVGTINDIADYYRFKIAETRALVQELVAEGAVGPVSVEGWAKPAYMDPAAVIPAKAGARCLLSPFDPLVWFRDRTERIFDFHYRIEIYTPKENRKFGYYTLPFLLGDKIAARIDLKHDRRDRVLLVRSVHPEQPDQQDSILEAVAGELRHAAIWVGAEDVIIERTSRPARALQKFLEESPDI